MHDDIRRFWNRRAEEDPFYFVDNRLGYRATDLDAFWSQGETDLQALLDAVGVRLKPSDQVVEIGCGVGRLTRALAGQVSSVRALDVSERMLALAQEHNQALTNVEWLLCDGASLTAVASESADVCISHVVFQHIPDPKVTMSYIREIGRVLRTDGWSAFQISNDPRVHARRPVFNRLRDNVLAALGRFPTGQHDRRWLGSMIELDSLQAEATAGSMAVERVAGEGTQFCCVLTRRHQ